MDSTEISVVVEVPMGIEQLVHAEVDGDREVDGTAVMGAVRSTVASTVVDDHDEAGVRSRAAAIVSFLRADAMVIVHDGTVWELEVTKAWCTAAR